MLVTVTPSGHLEEHRREFPWLVARDHVVGVDLAMMPGDRSTSALRCGVEHRGGEGGWRVRRGPDVRPFERILLDGSGRATASAKQAQGCAVRRAIMKAASAGSSNDLGGGGTSHVSSRAMWRASDWPVTEKIESPSRGTNASRYTRWRMREEMWSTAPVTTQPP